MRIAIKIFGSVVAVVVCVVFARYLVNSYQFSQQRAYSDAFSKPYRQKIAALPKDADSCRIAQGSWFEFGNSGRFYCRMKTRDSGRACKSSVDCEACVSRRAKAQIHMLQVHVQISCRYLGAISKSKARRLARCAVTEPNNRFERSRVACYSALRASPFARLRADLKVVLCRCGIVGEPRRESMIGINQLRLVSTQPRVAQPHR